MPIDILYMYPLIQFEVNIPVKRDLIHSEQIIYVRSAHDVWSSLQIDREELIYHKSAMKACDGMAGKSTSMPLIYSLFHVWRRGLAHNTLI